MGPSIHERAILEVILLCCAADVKEILLRPAPLQAWYDIDDPPRGAPCVLREEVKPAWIDPQRACLPAFKAMAVNFFLELRGASVCMCVKFNCPRGAHRCEELRTTLTRGAGSHASRVPWGQSMRSQPLTTWKLGLNYHFTWGPESQLWHGCLHDNTFLEVRLGTCVTSWAEQKNWTHLSTQVRRNIFAQNNQDPTLLIWNHVLVITWGSQVETWDLGPMWTGPHTFIPCTAGALVHWNSLMLRWRVCPPEITCMYCALCRRRKLNRVDKSWKRLHLAFEAWL